MLKSLSAYERTNVAVETANMLCPAVLPHLGRVREVHGLALNPRLDSNASTLRQ
jgi:hypothetical protein